MAKTPSELAKLINEMQNALQELSETQLEGVSSILSEQKEVVKKQTKVNKAKAKLEKQEKKFRDVKIKDNKEIVEKSLEQKKNIFENFDDSVYELVNKSSKYKKKIISLGDKLGNSLIDGLGIRGTLNAYKSIKGALSDPKQFLKERLFGKDDKKISSIMTIKKDLILSNSRINNLNLGVKGDVNINGQKISLGEKPKQSLLDFDAHKKDPTAEQVELLKEIDGKLLNLGVTGKDGGLFDFLSNGVKDLASSIVTGGQSVGVGAATAGVVSKFKSIPGIEKISSILSKIPKPTSKGALLATAGVAGIGGLGMAGKALYDGDTNLEPTEAKQRIEGGKVEKGKPYIVGEGGKELFVPKENGTIIPNKMSFAELNKEQFVKLKLSQKNRSSQFAKDVKTSIDGYNKPLNLSLSNYFKNYNEDYTTYKEDLKTSFTNMFDSLKSLFGNVGSTVKTVVVGAFNKVKEYFVGDSKTEQKTQINKDKEVIPQGDAPEVKTTLPQINKDKEVIPQGDAPEVKTTLPKMNAKDDIKPLPKEVKQYDVSSLYPKTTQAKSVVKTSYNLEQPREVDPNIDEKLRVEQFKKGYLGALKLTEPYKPSTKSNIVGDSFGLK